MFNDQTKSSDSFSLKYHHQELLTAAVPGAVRSGSTAQRLILTVILKIKLLEEKTQSRKTAQNMCRGSV